MADAEKALKSTQKMKICKREVRVEFFEMREKAKGMWDGSRHVIQVSV